MFAVGFLCRPSACKDEELIEISLEKDSERYGDLLMKEIFHEAQLDCSNAFDLQDISSSLASSNHNGKKDEHPLSLTVGTRVDVDALKFDVDLNVVQQRVLDQEQVISGKAMGNQVENKLDEKLKKNLDSVIQHVMMEKKFDYVIEKKFDLVNVNCTDDISGKTAPSTARCDAKSKDASEKDHVMHSIPPARDSAPHTTPRDANSKEGNGNTSSTRNRIHQKHVQGHGKDSARHYSPREASRPCLHMRPERGCEHGKHTVPDNSSKDLSHKTLEPRDSCCGQGRDNALHASPRDSSSREGDVCGNTSSIQDRINENHVQGHGKNDAWQSNPRRASRAGHQCGSSKSGKQRGDTVSPRFREPEEQHPGQREGEVQPRDLPSVPKGLVRSRISEIEKTESEGGNPKYPSLLTSMGGQRNDRQKEQSWQNKYLDCMMSVGDVLAVTDSSQVTQIGAAGGMFGHVLLVRAVPRCIQKHSPEYGKFLGSWPASNVREIYQVPVIESTRSTEGINETDLLLYINPKSGKITLHGEVDKDGDITVFENDKPEEVGLWQSPSVLRDSSCRDLKEQVIEEMKENQANWSWYTAMRAFMLPATMEDQSLTPFECSGNKQQLFKEIQECWNGAPICSSLPVIFWQRYLCKLSQSGRVPEKFIDKSGPLDMIMRYMPLRADRSLPGDLLKSLQTSGWTHIQQLSTQKHSMNFGVQRRHSRA